MIRSVLSALALASSVVACGQPQIAPTPARWMEKKVVSEAHFEHSRVHQQDETIYGRIEVKGGTRTWPLKLTGDKCYLISAVGDETLEELGLRLRASKMEVVEPLRQSGATALVSFCPTSSGTYNVQAIARRGIGHVAVGVFEREADDHDEGPNLVADALDAHARRTARGFARIGPAYRSTSLRAEWTIELVERHCYALIGEGSRKVTGLGLKLLTLSGEEITAADPDSPSVEIRYCTGNQKALYKLKAVSPSGLGEYFVGVFAGPAQ